MRYAIVGATVEQVKNAGGVEVKEAPRAGVIFATLTEEQVQFLRSQGFSVSRVGSVSTPVMPPIPVPPTPVLGAPRYTAEDLLAIAGYEELRGVVEPPLYGEGMNLAIVDTGIRETHEKIRGRVVYRQNFTSDPMRDGFDHGTGVASIAVAVAPKCNLLNIKVIDDKGQGTEEDLIMALDHLISLHEQGSEYAPQVVNLSLGAPDDGNPLNPVRVACRQAINRGMWLAAAAGNSGPASRTIMSPACERYVFAIGSAKYLPESNTFTVSDFSSRGPTLEGLTKPDGVLFGEDIVMASSASDTATTAKSGTSFATPFGAGMGILYLEGVNRRARTLEELVELPPAELYYVPPDLVIDQYFPRVCIKPSGVARGKDPSYGYGLIYGPLVMQALQPLPAAAIDFSPLLVAVPLMMIGMMVKETVLAGRR